MNPDRNIPPPSAVRKISTANESTTEFADIGLPILQVFPGVFNPESSFSGKFLARTIGRHADIFVGKAVIDVGCGCGVLGLACMAAGASRLVATDISANAARNTKFNSTNLGYSVETVSGDLFHAVTQQEFDFVIFNPPGFEGVPNSEVEAHYNCPVEVLERFYLTVPRYLSPNGLILTATSDIHDPTRSPKTFATKFGYDAKLLCSAKSQFGNQHAYLVRPNG